MTDCNVPPSLSQRPERSARRTNKAIVRAIVGCVDLYDAATVGVCVLRKLDDLMVLPAENGFLFYTCLDAKCINTPVKCVFVFNYLS